MVSQWPFYLNYIYKTFDQFNQQILSRFQLLDPSEQQYLLTENQKFKDYLASLQKIYLVYKRIKNSYSFFNSSLSKSKKEFVSFVGSLSFIQIDQLLMDMMDDLIKFDLHSICETSPFTLEPADPVVCRTLDSNSGCPVCSYPMGNQLLDDAMWQHHTICFNFYNHLEKFA